MTASVGLAAADSAIMRDESLEADILGRLAIVAMAPVLFDLSEKEVQVEYERGEVSAFSFEVKCCFSRVAWLQIDKA
jgi:hypothetical protein